MTGARRMLRLVWAPLRAARHRRPCPALLPAGLPPIFWTIRITWIPHFKSPLIGSREPHNVRLGKIGLDFQR
jgi:hypothetical protein